MTDILALKRMLADRAQSVAEHLLPAGIRHGREWCAGSTGGERGQSLKLVVQGAKAGTWADFASGESGDLIDLWRAVKRQSLTEALDDIRSWLGIEKPTFDKPARQYRRPAAPKCEAPRSAVLAYLCDERRISEEAISAYRVGEQGRRIIFRFFLPDGSLPFAKYRALDPLPDGRKDTRPIEADMEPVLFGWSAIADDAREVTITEGEIDAMSAWDYGLPALSVPFGGGKGDKQNWIASEFDRMAQFERINLALDNDAEGDAGAEEIANRLGRHRCRRVRLPRKDLNDCLKAGVSAEEIAKCFAESESLDPPELRRAGEFAGEVWRLLRGGDDAEIGYRLPFHRLAGKLTFRSGELTIWTGATGAGKSQIQSHAMVAMIEQGARICVASLEMAPRQFLRRMVKQAGNTSNPTEAFFARIMAWLDNSTWIFAKVGKSPVSRIIEVFEYARACHGCDVFVIDSLMRLGVGSEDYQGQEQAVFQLVDWAISAGVHLHLVAHARKTDRANGAAVADAEDIKGASEIGSNAFNILSVWRNRKLEDDIRIATDAADRGDPGAEAKLRELATMPPVILAVAKQRNGDFEGKIGLWFNPASYQYRDASDAPHGRVYVETMP